MFRNVLFLMKVDDHHGITSDEVDEIVWDKKTWPVQDWNMTLSWNKINYLILP